MVEKEYYNYVSFYRGIPVYVGKGRKNRWLHTIGGQSSNELLNDFYFRVKFLGDMPLDTYIVEKFNTSEEALIGEKKLIERYLPYCNKCSGRSSKTDDEIIDKIAKVCRSKGFSKPEYLMSKFDFRFLFTPKGLFCKSVVLDDNSPFEYAEFEYHIRVKKSLFKYFPEYFLQFLNHDSSLTRTIFTSVHTKALYHCENIIMNGRMFKGLSVDVDWMVEALLGKSFDFAEKFGFFCQKSDVEMFIRKSLIMDSHVNRHKLHLSKMKLLEVKKERKAQMKDEKLKREAELLARAKRENLVIVSPKQKDIKVEISDKVLKHAKDAGITFTGKGRWLNISTTSKPFISLNGMSTYKTVSQQDFCTFRLGSFRKE